MRSGDLESNFNDAYLDHSYSRPNLVEVEKRRLYLQEQLQKADVSIQQCQTKRSDLVKTFSEEQIELQKLTTEVDNLTEKISGSLLEQHIDSIQYIGAELNQLRNFKIIVDDLVQNKRAQLTAVHFELDDRLKRTYLQVDDLLRNSERLGLEAQHAEDLSISLNVIQDNGVLDGSEKATVVVDDISHARSIRESKARALRAEQIKQLNRERLHVIDALRNLQLRNKEQLHPSAHTDRETRVELTSSNYGPIQDQHDTAVLFSKARTDSVQAKVKLHRAELSRDLSLLNGLQQSSELKMAQKSQSDKSTSISGIRRLLIDVLLPPIIERIVRESISLDEINDRESLLRHQQNLQLEKENGQFLQIAVFEIWEDFLQNAVNELTLSVALDTINVHLTMYDTWKSQCMMVNKIQINTGLESAVDELVRLRSRFPHRYLLQQENLSYSRQNENTSVQSGSWSIFKRTKAKSHLTAHSKSLSVKQNDDLLDSDKVEDILEIYANHRCRYEAVSQSFAEFESEYCKNFEFFSRMVSGKGKTGYLKGKESRDGSLLLLAGFDGSLQLLNTEAEENNVELFLAPVRNRKWKSVDSGPWSLMNQIIALTDQNQVYVFDRPISRSSSSDTPYELSSEDIRGVTVDSNEKASEANLVAVHPTVTLNLTSISFMIAFTSGEIIRWNRATTGHQMLIGDFPPERPVISPKHSATIQLSRNSRRQRYVGHHSPILLMAFLGYSDRPDNLVSFDADGMLIIWDDESISGFGYICPRLRYQIKAVDVWYEDVAGTRTITIYEDQTGSKSIDSLNYDLEVRRQLLSAGYTELDYGVFYPKFANEGQGFQHILTYDIMTKRLQRHVKAAIKISHITGNVLDAKMTASNREMIILTWVPRHQSIVAQLAFFMVKFSETGSVSIEGPIVRYNYEGEADPSYNNSSMIWQITEVYNPLGTDILFTLPALSNTLQVISTATGSLLQSINLQTSISMIPKQIFVFDNSTQIAVTYMKTSAIDVWRIIDRNQPNQRIRHRTHPSSQTERVKRTPNEQISKLSSLRLPFGYLGKRPNHYFHVARKARALVLELIGQIVNGIRRSPGDQEVNKID